MATGEHAHPTPAHENEVASPSEYTIAAEQLLGLAASHHAHSSSYYSVDWDNEVPGRIQDVTLMNAAPTGARREERFGQFYQTQFEIEEATISGLKQRRFGWCHTGPREHGDSITFDPTTLDGERNYKELRTENIIDSLAEQARGVDDHISLIQAIRRRHGRPSQALTAQMNRLAYRFAFADVPSTAFPNSTLPTLQKVFQFMQEYRSYGVNIPQIPQTYFLSHMLRELTIDESYSLEYNPVTDATARMLQAALDQGVLPDEPRIVDRILATRSIYSFPFASRLLHRQLHTDPQLRYSRSVFGMHRVAFTHNYLTGILQSGTLPLNPDTTALVHTHQSAESITPEHLFNLVNGLSELVSGQNADISAPEAHHIDDVAFVFDHIISMMRAGSPQTAEQAALDDIYRENVAVILERSIRRLGRQGISAALDFYREK
jgi:hypothetical protein